MAVLVLFYLSFIQGCFRGTAFCLNASKTYRLHPFPVKLWFVSNTKHHIDCSELGCNCQSNNTIINHLILIFFLFNSCSNVGSTD